MKFNRELFNEYFIIDKIPEWTCPTCASGKLFLKEKQFTTHETYESQNEHHEDGWEPEWIREKFYGDLICSNKKCNEKTTIAGRIRVEPDYIIDEETNEQHLSYIQVYYPEYFYPYLTLFDYPENFPNKLEKSLESIFKLFWIDKSACANAIRIMIDEILTDQKINKTVKSKSGKRLTHQLHHRIEEFKKINPVIAEFLLAIKWIGNYGSHSIDMKHKDILHGIELLQVVIEKLYNDDKRLITIAKQINKKRKPLGK